MVKKGKQERTVIHLEMNGEHYYLGSLAAIYHFSIVKPLGLVMVRCATLVYSHEKPYQNKHCIIRKGVLLTISKKMTNEKHNTPLFLLCFNSFVFFNPKELWNT